METMRAWKKGQPRGQMVCLQDGRRTLKADNPFCLIIKGEDKGNELLTYWTFANLFEAFFAGFVRSDFQANLVSSG